MKSEFRTELDFKFENGKRKVWFGLRKKTIRIVRLDKPLVYYSELLDDVIIVPTGFGSDGASVPQIFWNIYPPFGKYLEAAIVHDYFYFLGRKGESWLSKKEADKVFREGLEVLGVSKVSRAIMYRAVSVFGHKFKEDDNGTVI